MKMTLKKRDKPLYTMDEIFEMNGIPTDGIPDIDEDVTNPTLKEFIEQNVVRTVVNQLHTGRTTYLNPEVERIRKEEIEKGEKFFYPYFDNGKCINKPDVMYVAKFEWTEEEYNEFMKGLE